MQAPASPATTPKATRDSPPRHASGRGENDADDETGLQDFAKDDEERCKHRLLGDDDALRGVLVIFAHEGVTAGIERPETHRASLAAADDFLNLEHMRTRTPQPSRPHS